MPPLSGITVAFDLDGTLVDTAPDLVRILNHLLGQEGFPPLPIAQARLFVGQGARVLLGKGAEAAGAQFAPDKLTSLTNEFLAIYGANVLQDSVPFPHLVPELNALKAAGAVLCVCTNKLTRHSLALIEALGLSSYFASIYGADSVANKKPDPGHLLATIAAANGDPARSVMVGDTSVDGRTAMAASVPFVYCAFGYERLLPGELSPILTLEGSFAGLSSQLIARHAAGALFPLDSAPTRSGL